MRQRLQTTEDEYSKASYQALGVDGKYQWPIRIITPLLFGATLLVNYLLGINSNKQVSDRFHLYVTPPGYFFIIWAVIYTGLIVANVYNLIKNAWNLKAHFFFGMTNVLNILWTVVFDQGTKVAVIIASFVLLALTIFIFFTWYQIGNVSENNRNIWTYINRNIFAFYLGWCIAATNLNIGMDIVYWWNASKQTQMIIFWVIAPLCAIGGFSFNCIKFGKYGFLSCFILWVSVAWAFAGAGITSHDCLNNPSQC